MCENHGQLPPLPEDMNLLLHLPKRRLEPPGQGLKHSQLFLQKAICTWRRLLEPRAHHQLDLVLVCTEQILLTSASCLQVPKRNVV